MPKLRHANTVPTHANKTAKTGGPSWFYAIGFVVLVSVLIYASIIILQRYS